MAEGQNVCSENKEIRETMRQMRVAPYSGAYDCG